MSRELCPVIPLFDGAVSTAFPLRFQDVSNIRQVPDQVSLDPSRDESLIVELLDFKSELIGQSNVLDAPGLYYRTIPAIATTAIGEMVNVAREGALAKLLHLPTK